MLPSLCKFRILKASKGPKECGLGPCAILTDELRPKRPAVAVSLYKLFFLLPNFVMMQEAMVYVSNSLQLVEETWGGFHFGAL